MSRKLQTRPTIWPLTDCGLDVSSSGAPVLELECLEALVLRLALQLVPALREGLRVEQLVEDVGELGGLVADGDELGRDVPDLGEATVEAGDGAIHVDDEDAVGCRVERGGEEGQGIAQLVLGVVLCRRVVGRDHEALHRGVVDQVHDAELEGDGGRAVVAQQPTRTVTGWVAVGAASGLGERGHDLTPVGLGDDVGERPHLDELGIVAEQPGDGPRGGLEQTGG